MPTFGLLGYPLSHSFSRPYFTDKFAQLGLSDTHRYLNFELADLADFPTILAAQADLGGLNVTIPYKQAVMAYLDALSPEARAIGAVNTILVENGKTTGYNTDVLGFEADLLDFLGSAYAPVGLGGGATSSSTLALQDRPCPSERSDSQEADREPLALRALVLGTGGASLAVQYVLRTLGIPATLVARQAGANRLTYAALTAPILAEHRLVINTTPLGMYPQLDSCPELPYAAFSAQHFCYDLVYNPRLTTLLRLAAEQGAATRNGLGMLHGQAEAAWLIWTGQNQLKG